MSRSSAAASAKPEAPALAPPGWTAWGGGPQRTHRAAAIGASAGKVKWKVKLAKSVTGAPIIGPDGTVYEGGSGGKLYALAPDGSMRWSLRTGGAIDASAALNAEGWAFIGSRDKKLYGISPGGPKKRWTLTLGGMVNGSPVTGADGQVHVFSADGKLTTVSSPGKVLWQYETGASSNVCPQSPALGPDGTLYICGNDQKLHALTPSGERRWSAPALPAGGFMRSVCLTDAGLILLPVDGGQLWAYDQKGKLQQKITLGFEVETAPAVSADGRLHVGSAAGDQTVHTLDPKGKPLGEFAIKSRVVAAPVVDRMGNLYFSAADRSVHAHTAAGKPLWTVTTGGALSSAPALGPDGTVYVGSGDGFLYAIG